ncbi:PEP-CTERM sorting domain-containing protein [Marinobacter halodurans]|nr:PEP-CTERM sorting domain-containing protein [Marinobacter halodurans]
MLSPSTADFDGTDVPLSSPSNCEPDCVESVFSTSDLTLLYKAEVGKSDSGTFASSYNATWNSSDPEAGTISFLGGSNPYIMCGECYLAVKDGNHSPYYYFFDISGWDGMESLALSGFWPSRGAISHAAIWGVEGEHEVPEPATLALLGIGLIGFAALRSRRQPRSGKAS